MDIKKDDIVEVWTGAAVGSPYPPRPGDTWLEARVLEVKGQSYQIAWTGPRPGCPWVARAAVRPCKDRREVVSKP
jgi:hypothetical protein